MFEFADARAVMIIIVIFFLASPGPEKRRVVRRIAKRASLEVVESGRKGTKVEKRKVRKCKNTSGGRGSKRASVIPGTTSYCQTLDLR